MPSGVAAKAKPKHTTTVRDGHDAADEAAKNLSRKCGTSKSATKVRSRRVSRPTKNRIRTITTYCDGGTRTAFTIKRSVITVTKTVTVPAATPVATPVGRRRRRRPHGDAARHAHAARSA